MADDEAPPTPRGPRVVTGDMVRQAGGPRASTRKTATGWAPTAQPAAEPESAAPDPRHAETLVSPGGDKTAAGRGSKPVAEDAASETLVGPAPPAPKPRGPRVVTGRTATPPAEPAPADAGEDTQAAPPPPPPPRAKASRSAAATSPPAAARRPRPAAATSPPATASAPGAAAATSPPATARAARPAAATSPPAASRAARPPAASAPDWVDPEWAAADFPDPAEPAGVIPPPVHRSAAPSRAAEPAGPSPKPGKAAKPAKPAAGGAREPLAVRAFLLALLSLPLTAILAIPALFVARKAKRRITERPGATGSGLVTGARVVAVLSLLAWATVAGVVVTSLVSPDGVDYAKLKAGDCIDTPEGTEVRRLTIRSCDEPHDAEVFAVVTHPAATDDAFPGTDALLAYAANACLGQTFTDYVGIPRGQSKLTEFEIVPESEAWFEGRRGLVCAVDNADRSPLTASVKGSAL